MNSRSFVFFIKCRCGVLILQLISVYVLPNHRSEDAFRLDYNNSVITPLAFFKGFNYWDAQHFLQVAEHGYKEEFSLAFFPGFPMLARTIATLFNSAPNIQLITFLLNLILSALCVLLLDSSSLHPKFMTGNENLTPFLFSINPATIFFTASYSESLYFLITLAILWSINRTWITYASILCFLSGFVRSNAMGSWFTFTKRTDKFIESLVLICDSSNDSGVPSICYKRLMFLPYVYVELKYWNVGMPFAYWSFRQLPNFLIALPTIAYAVYTLIFTIRQIRIMISKKKLLSSMLLLSHGFHLLFLVSFAVVFIHVQDMTRFLFSSSPLLYYYANYQINKTNKRTTEHFTSLNHIYYHIKQCDPVLSYFYLYFLMGTLLFSCGVPWT
ncbi:hypothetical protein GJ496_010069 [Pomphorhynchus laevis]|nr:hypothetical protein GJ496_010069 [Pomphorhynchus laevis]